MDQAQPALALTLGGVRLPYRNVDVEHDGATITLRVPRGIGRNNRNNSWQIKIARNGKTVVSGNIADGSGSPGDSLEIAIQMVRDGIEKLGGQERLTTLKGVGRGARVAPFRIDERVTLHWKLIDTTPSLYAQVYSPLLKKGTAVNVGSERSLEKTPQRLRDRVAHALVWADRVAQESEDPFAPVMFDEIQPFLETAAALVKTDGNPALQEFLDAGKGIREKAEQQRDEEARKAYLDGIRQAIAERSEPIGLEG